MGVYKEARLRRQPVGSHEPASCLSPPGKARKNEEKKHRAGVQNSFLKQKQRAGSKVK
jgi:hypothetical protein